MKFTIQVPESMRIMKLSRIMDERRLAGEPTTLRMLLNEMYPKYNPDNPAMNLEKYYQDMGITFHRTTVSNMIELAESSEEYKWLWKETLLAAIHTAAYTDPLHLLIIAYSKTHTGKVATMPMIDTSDMRSSYKKEKAVAAGGTFEEDSITFTDKTKKYQKFGKTLKIPYEVISDCTLDVISEFMKGYMGIVFDGKLDMVLDALISGDGATNSLEQAVDSSAAEIGVDNTTNGIQFKDIKRGAIRLSRLKKPADVMIGSEAMINNITELEEFKKRYEGTPLSPLTINGYKSLPDAALITDTVNENDLVLVSKNNAVAEFIKQALMIETDKIISRQMIEVVISEWLCYLNIFRDAKLIIDGSKAFSSNGFPSWMTVTKGK